MVNKTDISKMRNTYFCLFSLNAPVHKPIKTSSSETEIDRINIIYGNREIQSTENSTHDVKNQTHIMLINFLLPGLQRPLIYSLRSIVLSHSKICLRFNDFILLQAQNQLTFNMRTDKLAALHTDKKNENNSITELTKPLFNLRKTSDSPLTFAENSLIKERELLKRTCLINKMDGWG